MGAWGYTAFEDDTALDWIGDFATDPSIEKAAGALDEALEADFIDDLVGPHALAAAEIVAAINGKPSDALPEDAAEWGSGQASPEPGLLKKASSVVQQVYEESELREIWEDSDGLEQWKEAIDDLRKRLA